ncbi:MAG: hypothetical protein KJO60_11695 [Desulfofustis sp.]|nr:hypothetical protein [Desulfofustis sp.]MBT8355180.1 hypothetical protein [Desulfofustis sp.]NNK58462.1 hypothetical protein [Desulfofustis sp.]
MIKEFTLTLPLGLEQSYELVRKSGDQIMSWGAHRVTPEDYYLEWKQSFWSLSGTTLISVTLVAMSEGETKVTAMIHKPMQLFDPVGICYRVFSKLEKSIQKNLSQLGS